MMSMKVFAGSIISFVLGFSGVVANATPLTGVAEIDVSSFDTPFDGTNYEGLGSSPGNFGTEDFTIQFTLKARSSTGQGEGLLSKRPACGGWDPNQFGSGWFDLRIFPNGQLAFEMGDVTSASSYYPLVSKGSVYDGLPHRVKISRTGNVLSINVSGLGETSRTVGSVNIQNKAEMLVGTSPCVNFDGTQMFVGEISAFKVVRKK